MQCVAFDPGSGQRFGNVERVPWRDDGCDIIRKSSWVASNDRKFVRGVFVNQNVRWTSIHEIKLRRVDGFVGDFDVGQDLGYAIGADNRVGGDHVGAFIWCVREISRVSYHAMVDRIADQSHCCGINYVGLSVHISIEPSSLHVRWKRRRGDHRNRYVAGQKN